MYGCAAKSNHSLNNAEVLNRSLSCLGADTLIITTPSRGLIGDSMAISSAKSLGSDGGFYDDFQKNIDLGIKNIAVYSSSSEKVSVYLLNTLSKYEDKELKGINICYIGDAKYSEKIEKEVIRTGADFKYKIPIESNK